MVIIDRSLNDNKETRPASISVQTTIYELIKAFNEKVLPEEDWVVAPEVIDLLTTGQAEFISLNKGGCCYGRKS